ncbi:fatty acyl-CoA reductase wat-like [Sipha flava]|uniref:Fatty acyl-CoA reductase n=1 Tax=Sipha flava TaxID=143950 RepID=A0A8B8FF95_9HEMI|nr:fatty acyl-CoA reductase wat-like [Sipha flava]
MTTTPLMDNYNSNCQNITQQSEIQSFYNDTTIFLTGATGFVGNLILEKLIRTCSGVKKIYILIREKKEKTTEERFKQLFEDPIFSLMKKEQPNYLTKISVIIGDCSMPSLGIDEQNKEILKNEVNIVIHSAATVRFDEHLRTAVNININALQDILKLSKGIKNLKSFVHISTAYSYCAGRDVVDEMFYPSPISGEKLSNLVNSLDDDYINRITPALLGEWPNTYAMTKAIAEGEIIIHGKGLPVGIIRPSMIIATSDEPLSGWINNVYGPTGVVAATWMGLMRIMIADQTKIADVVPADYVSNAVLACAWDIHNQWKEHNNANDEVKDDGLENDSFVPPIYNYVSSSSNPLTWGEFMVYNKKYGYQKPSVKAIWPLLLRLTKYHFEYIILCFLLHTVPAFVIDSIAKLTGRKPQLVDGYKKMHKFSRVLSYFSLKSWLFRDNNTRSLVQKLSKLDRTLFNFDISKLNWDSYFERHMTGIRLYIFQDPVETLPEGHKHCKRLYMAYYTLMSIFAALFVLILYRIVLLFL